MVDKNEYHTYTPTLYEIATTSKNLANQIDLKSIVTFPLHAIFKKKKITILKETVAQVDLIEGDIHFDPSATGQQKKLKFDYLVLGLGSETNYFGIPGLKENSLALKTFIDALKIRDTIWERVSASSPDHPQKLRIVIGGAGATGVELAGEIKSWLGQLREEYKYCSSTVSIIQAMPTVLPGFPEKIIEKVTKRLKEINVGLLLNETIAEVKPEKIILKSGRVIEYDIFIWTGGVKAASLMSGLPLKKEEKGRVMAEDQMECLPQSSDLKLYGKIYGFGDAICFYDPVTGKPIPYLAEAAIQGAEIVAHNIIEDIKMAEQITRKAGHKKYTPPKEYAYIIPVGGKYAVAKVGPIILSGLAGWILKGLVEFYYLLWNVLPPMQTLRIWLKGLKIFVQNDRLG